MIATREVGRTGVRVTTLGLGTAPFGDLFHEVPPADVVAAVDAAWEAGIRFYDTAPFYGHGKAELRLGHGLAGRAREDYVLSTKVGRCFRRPANVATFRPSFWRGALPFEIVYDYSYDGIMRSVEDSYLRLGINRVDLLLIHDLDTKFFPVPEQLAAYRAQLLTSGWRALDELRSAGVVGGFGAGINERGMMSWFLEAAPVDFFIVALPYTLLDQDVLDDEFPASAAAGAGVVIGSVFASGILATGAKPGAKYAYEDAGPEVMERVRRMEAVASAHGVRLAAAALQFPLAHDLVAAVIPGALSPDHVRANVALFEERIPAAFWSTLKAEGLIREDAPVPEGR